MIPIKKEPQDVIEAFGSALEKCIFCESATRHWYEEQTPVCQKCAFDRDIADIPKKKLIVPRWYRAYQCGGSPFMNMDEIRECQDYERLLKAESINT